MASQPMENALSEQRESKGSFARLRLAIFLGEQRPGKPATNAKAASRLPRSRRRTGFPDRVPALRKTEPEHGDGREGQ
jgi:hypothetical protein